jgi:hypothetical protein
MIIKILNGKQNNNCHKNIENSKEKRVFINIILKIHFCLIDIL